MLRRLANKLRALNMPWQNSKFQGKDLDGNMYFEGDPIREGISLPRRTVVYADGRSQLSQYVPDAVPVQWQAWLRHTRPDAPTIEELQQELQRQAWIKEKAREIEQRDLAAMAAQRASAITPPDADTLDTKNAQQGVQPEPQHGNVDQQQTYQPDAWKPLSKR